MSGLRAAAVPVDLAVVCARAERCDMPQILTVLPDISRRSAWPVTSGTGQSA